MGSMDERLPRSYDRRRDIRIGHAERQQVVERLRVAAGAGYLDIEELEQRLEVALTAKTYGDLERLTIDLPRQAGGAGPQPVGSASRLVVGPRTGAALAMMSGASRGGDWVVPEHFTAFAVMGGVDLDLREASFAASTVTIHAHALMGGVTIVVDPQTRVVVEGVGLMGGYAGPRTRVSDRLRGESAEELGPDSPTVRVTGVAVMGGVTVRRKRRSRRDLRRGDGRRGLP